MPLNEKNMVKSSENVIFSLERSERAVLVEPGV